MRLDVCFTVTRLWFRLRTPFRVSGYFFTFAFDAPRSLPTVATRYHTRTRFAVTRLLPLPARYTYTHRLFSLRRHAAFAVHAVPVSAVHVWFTLLRVHLLILVYPSSTHLYRYLTYTLPARAPRFSARFHACSPRWFHRATGYTCGVTFTDYGSAVYPQRYGWMRFTRCLPQKASSGCGYGYGLGLLRLRFSVLPTPLFLTVRTRGYDLRSRFTTLIMPYSSLPPWLHSGFYSATTWRKEFFFFFFFFCDDDICTIASDDEVMMMMMNNNGIINNNNGVA